MNWLKYFFYMTRRQPFIILITGLFSLLITIYDIYNPITPIILGLSKNGEVPSLLNFLELILKNSTTFMQIFFNGEVFFYVLAVLFVFSLVFSLLFSLLFAGYFKIVSNAIENKPIERFDYFRYTKIYFRKFFTITLKSLLLGVGFILFSMTAMIPAVTVTNTALQEGSQFMFAALMLDFITAFALITAFLFLRVYVFYWFPSSLSEGGQGFIGGKYAADLNFVNTSAGLLLFDFIYIAYLILFFYFVNFIINTDNYLLTIIIFLLNWMFKTFYFTSMVLFIFKSYKTALRKIN